MFAQILLLLFHFCSGNTTNNNETNLDDIILTQSRALEAATFLLANQNRMETQLRILEEKLDQMEGKETAAKEEGTSSVKTTEPVAEFAKMQKTLEEINAP
ncbi:Oidioi.mRNA.OKI2018_I69.chr2.g6737.t1.cds [Oikopleura dioica]|uniref:Oidioi.mRNA.OKI2018_I69.chr2.g6737.t1.cds n=1 Tax=Oikopleura dioica TaxID=34765 RepID=A0ABN7T7I4_OIKDI|nr:Oidioi.mRNA.OKI2018_I69.chr2.g6737.t1.cds [Oikopleura dioica]